MNTVILTHPEGQPNVTLAYVVGSIGYRFGWHAHSRGDPIEALPTAEQFLAHLLYEGRFAESDSEFHLKVLRNNLDELQADFRDGWNARHECFAETRAATAAADSSDATDILGYVDSDANDDAGSPL